MAVFPYQYANIRGIPCIQTRSITVSDTSVDFKFNPDWDSRPFRGLLLVNITEEIPAGTTTTLPIRFSMAGTTSNLTYAGGDNVTVADLSGTGVHIVYYDRFTDTLQLMA